jgi:hypothetical protein
MGAAAYGKPELGVGRVVERMVRAVGCRKRLTLCCADTAGDSESVTWSVNDTGPEAVGVPVTAPVEGLSDRPAGSVPFDT